MNIQPSIDLKKVNLQTAVGYLVSLHENEYQWNLLGVKVIGVAPTEADIPEGTYEYGDAYEVGTEPPYDLYIYTRPDGKVHTEGYWFNTGKFPMPGPQGPKGDGLEQIIREASNTAQSVSYDSTSGATIEYTDKTVIYKDSTTGETKTKVWPAQLSLPILPGKYMSMDANAENDALEVKVDDTELALDYIKIDKTAQSTVPQYADGKIKWTKVTGAPIGSSIVARDDYGATYLSKIYVNRIATTSNEYEVPTQAITYGGYSDGFTIEKTPTDTGTVADVVFDSIMYYPNAGLKYDNRSYIRMDPINAPDGTLNFIHIDSIQDGNSGYKATGKCFSITVSTKAWQVVDLDFGSGIYQHKIGFTLDGTNSWYITLVLTTSSAQAITQATLYKYLTNGDSPLFGGIPVDCYRTSVQNPAGFGNGRMSATYNAETQRPTYYFALSNENTQETVSTSTASISGFIDTVTKV